jgi:DNA-binding SARP family transcriptional activator/tetratricopeptide (TPR) repeat protein
MSELSPTLRVLGVPALHGPDGEPITFRTRKHFALLIYLALEPSVHRREKLGALLWPRATTAEARHSLATGLSVLRARLGRERIETTRDTARLASGSVELDLDRLARGEIHATETTPALAVAPLLQEFVVADAAPWDQWRDALSAKWQPAIRDALLARIDRSRRQGNTRAMELLADALLTLDDLSEDGVRAKMESRAFAGDRLTALQIYEDWRVRLADELGAQPSDLVAGMALRLRRRGWERTSGENIPSIRTDQWKDRPFVGRAKEYEVLYEGWEGCQRGVLRHVLLTGESGVGKSTLVERLTTAAGLQGAVACRVQCHEVEREIPYGAIGALITLLLERPGATAVAPEWLSELSRTVSAVRRKFPNVAPAVEATGEMVRIRLADAFHELVRAIADEQPLILVMDDIHLGDDASVAVMHLLLRRLTDEHLLVACTLRHGERALAPSARGMLERAEIAQMSVVPLPPLTEGESTELLGQLIPGEVTPPPSTVRRALLRAGGGLPMLLELLVRDWLTHGDRCVALAVEAMTEEPGTAGGAGETYRRLLERLTVDLDPSARSVLNLAAVLGSQLNEFDLYGLVDVTLAQAMGGLSHLAALRILRDGGHGLEFVNEVMRGEVYLAVPSSVRKVLHSKVADRLIERATAGEEMLGLAIAWHCMRSSRVQEAGEWLIKGGEEAIARSALAEAEAALESGLRNLPSDTALYCGALLVDVLIDQLRFVDVQEVADTLERRSPPHTGERVGQAVELARLALRTQQASEHSNVLPRVLSLIESSASDDLRLRAAAIGAALASDSQVDSHIRALLSSITRAQQLAPVAHVPRFELLKAQLLYWQRDMQEVESILEGLLATDTADGPGQFRQNLYLGLAISRVARGDYHGSLPPMTHAATLAIRAGSPSREASAYSNLAVSHLRIGSLEAAMHCANRAQHLWGNGGHSISRAGALGVELVCHALSGAEVAFQHKFKESVKYAESGLSPGVVLLTRLWIADAVMLTGEPDKACAVAQAALNDIEEPPIAWLGAATRWAGVLHKRNRTIRLASFVEASLKRLHKVDALDRFEIAQTALTVLQLTPTVQTEVWSVASKAEQMLPSFAVGLLKRIGLPAAVTPGLSQDFHPAT